MRTTVTIEPDLWKVLEAEAIKRNQSVPSMRVAFAYSEMRRKGHKIDPTLKGHKIPT